jgi:tetratricopeptide (TPR) repeat protein
LRSARDFGEAISAAERARGGFKTLELQLNEAIALHATVQSIVREIEQALQSAGASEKALASKKALLTPSLAKARQDAEQALSLAREQMATGVRSSMVSLLTEARAIAQSAAVKYGQVLDAVIKLETRTHEARVAGAVTQAQEAFSFVDGGLASLDRLALEKPTAVPPRLAEERAALEKEIATARRRFEAAQQRRDLVGIEDAVRLATTMRTRVDTLISSFGPVSLVDRGVRPTLMEGARFYFAGEYQQALAALDPASLTDVPLQLHVHLLRAAAHYGLYVRSGEKDQSQRSQAAAEIEKVKQLSPDFQPDARVFAPRFISFFLTGEATAQRP